MVGIRDPLKTQLPVGLVVLKAGVTREHAVVTAELVQRVRDLVGPVANFRMVAIVSRLPKTRSGKVLRKTVRSIADGESVSVPATIEDPTVLDEIQKALQTLGLAGNPRTAIGG